MPVPTKSKLHPSADCLMTQNYFRPTWIEIDLSAVRSNVLAIKKHIGSKVHLMAVVKANGDGHGIIEISREAISSGATWIGVATMDEAIIVRLKVDKQVPILVFGYVAPEHLSIVSKCKITVTAISLDWIKAAAAVAKQQFDFHLKLDTGLNRIGCKMIEEVQSVIEMVSNNPNMNWTGAYTHFATADDTINKSYMENQLSRFQEFLKVIPNISEKIIHCANSCYTLYHPGVPYFDMVRVGRGVMGPPSEASKQCQHFPLKTSISLHSVLVQVKQLDAGEKIGYCGEYVTTEREWIGTIPMGYGDGWRQQFKTNAVLIDGVRVPIVGRISMDQITVGLTKQYPVGTRVTFIGRQGNEQILGDEIANTARIPRSQLYVGLSSRIPRLYFVNGQLVNLNNVLLKHAIQL